MNACVTKEQVFILNLVAKSRSQTNSCTVGSENFVALVFSLAVIFLLVLLLLKWNCQVKHAFYLFGRKCFKTLFFVVRRPFFEINGKLFTRKPSSVPTSLMGIGMMCARIRPKGCRGEFVS